MILALYNNTLYCFYLLDNILEYLLFRNSIDILLIKYFVRELTKFLRKLYLINKKYFSCIVLYYYFTIYRKLIL